MPVLRDFHATTLSGDDRSLSDFAGDVVLVVNTASKCGFTPQLAGLEKLYDEYQGKGLAVLGFPCNQFGNQEPGTADEIGEFCQRNYGVSFPMFDKVDVNGESAHPLWTWLRQQAPEGDNDEIRWNFEKFLVGRDGTVLRRYDTKVEPAAIADDIEGALAS